MEWLGNDKMLLDNILMEQFFLVERLFFNSFSHPLTPTMPTRARVHTHTNKKHFALDTHELCGPLVNSHTDIQALTHVHSNALCYLILYTHKHPQAHTPMCTPMHTHAHTRTHTHLHSHAPPSPFLVLGILNETWRRQIAFWWPSIPKSVESNLDFQDKS